MNSMLPSTAELIIMCWAEAVSASAHHHAGLGVDVRVLQGPDAGDDFAVADERLRHIVERVRRAPDVEAAAGDREGPVRVGGASGDADVADVLTRPWRGQPVAGTSRW